MPSPDQKDDWGVPDGRDPAAYGDISKWSRARWRWEFTRRRPDYRQDFDDNVQATLDQLDEERRQSNPAKRFLGRDDPGFVVSVPDPGASIEKYGLGSLPNPRISEQPFHVLFFRPNFGGVMQGKGPSWLASGWAAEGQEETATMLVPDGSAAALFDLSKPLNPQFKTAKQILTGMQKARNKKTGRKERRDLWFRHLRVLDAYAAGATGAEIARSDILGKHNRLNKVPEDGSAAARDALEAAQHLMFNWP